MAALHKLLEDGSSPHKLSYAPQRFISHAQPARVLIDSFECIASYLHELAGKDGEQGAWARAMNADVKEMRSWLLVSIIADLLLILRRLNLRTQRSDVRVLQVDPLLDACREEIEDYMKPGTGGLARGLKEVFQPHSSAAGAESKVMSFCKRVHVKTLGVRILSCTFKFGRQGEYALRITHQTLDECVEAAREIKEIIFQDLESRFAHTGVAKFFYVLSPSDEDLPEQPFDRAMHGLAKHFDMDAGVLAEEFRHVLRLKTAHLAQHPQKKTLPPHLDAVQFWKFCIHSCLSGAHTHVCRSHAACARWYMAI